MGRRITTHDSDVWLKNPKCSLSNAHGPDSLLPLELVLDKRVRQACFLAFSCRRRVAWSFDVNDVNHAREVIKLYYKNAMNTRQ
jgi:hypothetical protein